MCGFPSLVKGERLKIACVTLRGFKSHLTHMPHWRNWIAHQTSNLGVVGSSPTWGTFVAVAQHGPERSAFNRVVEGSNPSRDTSHISSVGLERMAFNHMVVGSSPTCDIV